MSEKGNETTQLLTTFTFRSMSGISTWRDLLLPDGQDTRITLPQVDDTRREVREPTARASALSLLLWNPKRLPCEAHLIDDLPSKMQEHLRVIIDQSYSSLAARTSFADENGYRSTPNSVLGELRKTCRYFPFRVNCESRTTIIADRLSYAVTVIMRALGQDRLMFLGQDCSSDSEVITDNSYLLRDEIKILWANKSSKVFDEFVEELMRQMRTDEELASLCTETTPTVYEGYKAILGKLAYHAGDVQPRIRWAIVFGGLRYVIIYIPRMPAKPKMYCSPVMRFCFRDNDEQDPAIQPPIWSMVVYMLLTEILNVDDETLRQRFGLPVLSEDPSSLNLGSRNDARGLQRSATLEPTINQVDERSRSSHSGKLTETPSSMTVQCLDALPIELTLVDTPHPRRAEKQNRPFIHLDRQLGAVWSSVYASSKSHIVVKFATVPKKDKAELEDQLLNEKAAYHKLSRISGWVIPRLYGEYEWYGGRAIVLSYEGQSLSHHESLISLSLVERLILFGELYCLHFFGVRHEDVAPRNVLRKKWSCFLKIIDFGFSDINHSCPGWKGCGELEDVWYELKLDRVNFWPKAWVEKFKFKIRLVVGMGQRLLLSMIIAFTLLVFTVSIIISRIGKCSRRKYANTRFLSIIKCSTDLDERSLASQ